MHEYSQRPLTTASRGRQTGGGQRSTLHPARLCKASRSHRSNIAQLNTTLIWRTFNRVERKGRIGGDPHASPSASTAKASEPGTLEGGGEGRGMDPAERHVHPWGHMRGDGTARKFAKPWLPEPSNLIEDRNSRGATRDEITDESRRPHGNGVKSH